MIIVAIQLEIEFEGECLSVEHEELPPVTTKNEMIQEQIDELKSGKELIYITIKAIDEQVKELKQLKSIYKTQIVVLDDTIESLESIITSPDKQEG
jgi:peptidoglycan hydrolase CwlO-like protein